jgi:Tol biopolymer transport system component
VASHPPERFGPYDVVGLLGAGGMGQVYRARDPRLKRDVAIKVLARAGTDPVRQRRFTDEAQAASALNHPNIVTVYDVGTQDGVSYIVSEAVEGTSLREVLARAPLSVRDALDLGAQMADGLAAAHQAGIVHRDFKPENVMVTRDGRAKILDFGLALVGMRDGVSATEVDVTLTVTGMLVGTVPYMSPEQARGAAVDYRTDQFSLGLTLYEILTGRRAFRAETAAQTLTAILEDEPEPIGQINPRVPAPVRWIIERCLAKDARQRYDATADLARDLRMLRDRVTEFAPSMEAATALRPRHGRQVIAVTALAIAVCAAGLIAGLANPGGGASLEKYRFTPIATDAGYQASPAWSPDGKTLAYIADVDGVLQVFTRALASPRGQQVTHARFYCRDPFWSPDGSRLFYISLARESEGLWSISAAGGDPELVMEAVSAAALSPDGKTLAFFREGEPNVISGQGVTANGSLKLWLSSPVGAPPVPYTRPPFGARRGFVQTTLRFAPDGSKLGAWVIVGADVNDLRPEFWVLPTGDGAPYIVPPPVADLPGVAAAFSWLPDSRRVLSALSRPRPGTHVWLTDTVGGASRLLTATGGVENDPAVSPDGTSLALAFQQVDYDLYQLSLEHPSPSVVLATSRNEMDPAWSAAATAMAYTTDRSGREEIWLRSQKGDFERPLVTPSDFGTSETYLLSAPAISPDGQRIAYNRVGQEGYGIWITPVAGGPPVRLIPPGGYQDLPSWSPDGMWVAFAATSSQSGIATALMKMRVGARTPPELLAQDMRANGQLQWSPDGAWIAYNASGGLSIVSPDAKSRRIVDEQSWMAFSWSVDSQRLFGIRQSDDFKHLTFSSIEISSGKERVLGPDILPLPVAFQPVRGFTRVSPTTFIASIARVRSDVWLLQGFDAQTSLRDRLGALLSWRH